jgi:hypothetical protein
MPRLALAALTCLAVLLPASGCYNYDARAKNVTGHDVRISLHKGTHKREVSTVVLAPGASVGWTGSLNGPVLLRVAGGGESIDVGLPRRAHTLVEVGSLGGELQVSKTVGGETVAIAAACPADCDKPCCAVEVHDAEDGDADSADHDDGEMIDLIESDDG